MAKDDKRQVLWAPWRMEYILGEKEKGCIFCSRWHQDNDRDNLILARGECCFVIMNRYPYNNGHLMVVPARHIDNLTALQGEESTEMMRWLQRTIDALNLALQPHGYNIGLNLGKVSGAGVDDHMHFHVVPRWDGDTNFMPIISDTKVVSEGLFKTYDKLKTAFETLKLKKPL